MSPERVLVCLAGLSPQVISETVWALAVARRPRWAPRRLIIATTTEGAARAAATLLDPQTGALRGLAEEYPGAGLGHLPEASEMRLLGDTPDAALTDLVDPQSVRTAADGILELIRDLTAEPESELQLSIAGGRKSLGALAALALSLFGRTGRDEPRARQRALYKPSRLLLSAPRAAAAARDRRLRPFHGRGAGLAGRDPVSAAAHRIAAHRLPSRRFSLGDRCCAAGYRGSGAHPRLRARSRPLGRQGLSVAALGSRSADGAGDRRACAGEGLDRASTPQSALLPFYARIARPVMVERARALWGDPIEPERMEQLVSRLNKLAALAGIPERAIVMREGERAHARYRLALPASRIVLVKE